MKRVASITMVPCSFLPFDRGGFSMLKASYISYCHRTSATKAFHERSSYISSDEVEHNQLQNQRGMKAVDQHVEASVPSSSKTVFDICNFVAQCYEDGDRRLQALQFSHELSFEEAAAVVTLLTKKEGSVVGMSFFLRAIGYAKFRYMMRFYVVAAGSFLNHGNAGKAQEVLRYMVSSFAEVGKLKDAVDMIFEMQNQGLALNIHTLNWALKFAVVHDFDFAEHLFNEIQRNRVSLNSCSFKTMIVAYSRKGCDMKIDKLLKKLLEKGLLVDNAICTLVVVALCELNSTSRVHEMFRKMCDGGLTPNMINYTAFINKLCKRGNVKQAFQVLEEMVGKGMKPNVYTHTTLIDGLCKIGWTEKAFRLFLKLVRSDSYKPNVYTYTAMIGGYCKENKMNRAEMLLARMKEQGLIPNTTTYTTLINGHCKEGNLERAFETMEQMKKEGYHPNMCTYNAIINGLLKKRRIQEASKMLKMAYECGVQPDKITYTILIGEHCKQGDIVLALDLFYQMLKYGFLPDIHTYTTLISLFCKHGKMEDSKKLFDEALALGLIPRKHTFTSMISGYCRDSNVSYALHFFNNMTKNGCVPDAVTYGALISGLCKESRLDEAHKLYDAMLDKGLVPCEVTRVTLPFEYFKKNESVVAVAILNRSDKKLWIRTVNILVRKLSSKGLVDPANLLFHMLLDKEKNVNNITYVAFVNACYDNGRYSVLSDLSQKISLLAEHEAPDTDVS